MYLLIKRVSIFENCYALKFVMWKFYELSINQNLKIAQGAGNPNFGNEISELEVNLANP